MIAILAELPFHLTPSSGPLAVGSNLLPVNIFAAAVIIVAGATAAISLRKK
jgi:hypothetical protein